jgi:phospholipid/cholesterol/gamma-HCH transport system substrate-binding protein
METRANHVWVGAVTLLLLAGLAAAIVWIGRFGQNDQRHFDILFSQAVDGLSKGSSVNFSGVPVGQVEKVELWPKDPNFVRVRIKVENQTPILVGTTASIQLYRTIEHPADWRGARCAAAGLPQG